MAQYRPTESISRGPKVRYPCKFPMPTWKLTFRTSATCLLKRPKEVLSDSDRLGCQSRWRIFARIWKFYSGRYGLRQTWETFDIVMTITRVNSLRVIAVCSSKKKKTYSWFREKLVYMEQESSVGSSLIKFFFSRQT